jgi:hypothetical protein
MILRLGSDSGAVQQAFLQRQQPVTVDFLRLCSQCFIQRSAAYPLLKTPLTGLIGWILLGHFSPLRPRAQNPQLAIQNRACVLRWPSPPIGPLSKTQQRF